jgi:hypothetical protein
MLLVVGALPAVMLSVVVESSVVSVGINVTGYEAVPATRSRYHGASEVGGHCWKEILVAVIGIEPMTYGL